MEDILNLYEQPYDPDYPMLCFDERPCQLIEDVVAPLPMKPGKPEREDYEYHRNGTCCVFLAFEPLTGQRVVRVRKRRTKVDYASFMQELVEVYYPHAKSIRLVQDNLNTHSPASLYETFDPEVTFELAQKFEYHYTPKKGSWLNMAEIELSALARQCLKRRIGDQETFENEVMTWSDTRNEAHKTVRWKFTTSEARRKLHRKYPTMQN